MKGTSSRSRQRRQALRILFEMDINNSSLEEVLEGKRKVGEEEPGQFTIDLVRGVTVNLAEIDRVLSMYSEGWQLARMPGVDRNVLRMSIYEIFFMDDIPPGATIDEAVELAKYFSKEDSGKFINGLLGKVNRDRELGKLSLPAG
jgi:transcription antitermination protein NusB